MRERLLVLGAAALLFLPGLGRLGLWAPDEPRYGQVAEELRSFVHGRDGLVLLHLNGAPYDQKPPLYFWAAALAGTPADRVTEGAARLPSALAGIACVALVFALGQRLLSPHTALLGALIFLTSQELAHLARRAQLDVVLTLFETLALYAFVRLERGAGSRRANVALLHAALGLAVLTKGPVGFLVPLGVIAVWLGLEGRLRDLRRLFPPWAPLLSLGPGLAWIAGALALAPAGFFQGAVIDNLWGRVAEGTSHPRPLYYYLYQFPVDALPWSLAWPLVAAAGWRRVFAPEGNPERRRAWRFLLTWVAVPFVFFSLSSGKRGLYLLPALPAAALLTADALLLVIRERAALPRAFVWVARALTAVALGAGTWLAFVPRAADLPLPRALGGALAVGTGAAGAAWWWAGRSSSTPSGVGCERTAWIRLGIAVAWVWMVLACIFHGLYPSLDGEKSPLPIARAAAALTREGAPIGLLGSRPLTGGIAYYSGRRVEELDSPDAARAFLESGGDAVVLEARKLDALSAVLPVRVEARARAGDRALVVVTRAAPRTSTPPR